MALLKSNCFPKKMMKIEGIKLTVQDNLDPDNARVLDNILEQHNQIKTNLRRASLTILLRDSNDQIIGGVYGKTAWGLLYVNTLVVEPQFRVKGYGAKLLMAAEQEAIARGCYLAHLHTMNFQAREFYEKYGYVVFEILEGIPNNYKRYFLKKQLS